MKRLFALILVMAMAAMFPISASAAGPDARSSVYYEWVDDWDDDWDDDWAESIYEALEEKVWAEFKGKYDLPLWCWYDIDRDGLSEIIVDNTEGKYGVDVSSSKNFVGVPKIAKGDFTIYYWDYGKGKAASLKVNSNNMYISVHPEGYIVTSTLKGNTETYNIYGYHHIGTKLVAKTFTLSGTGDNFQIKVKNPDGSYESDNEDWAYLEILNILNKCTPLTFHFTS